MSFRSSFAKFFLLAIVGYASVFAQSPAPQSGPSSITVSGTNLKSLTLSAADLASMPREKATVPEQDGTQVEYEGVSLREVLKRAGAPIGKLRGKALSSCVLAKASDGYQVVFTLGEIDPEFGNEQIIIADKRDGKPLFGYQGPFRITVPHDKAGARSVRMLVSIELVSVPAPPAP